MGYRLQRGGIRSKSGLSPWLVSPWSFVSLKRRFIGTRHTMFQYQMDSHLNVIRGKFNKVKLRFGWNILNQIYSLDLYCRYLCILLSRSFIENDYRGLRLAICCLPSAICWMLNVWCNLLSTECLVTSIGVTKLTEISRWHLKFYMSGSKKLQFVTFRFLWQEYI